jgi:hypothetical protein
MIGLLSRIPNAQKATSYDEGSLKTREGRQQYRVGEQNRDPPDKIMISRLGSEVKHSHLADCAALRDCSGDIDLLGKTSFAAVGSNSAGTQNSASPTCPNPHKIDHF